MIHTLVLTLLRLLMMETTFIPDTMHGHSGLPSVLNKMFVQLPEKKIEVIHEKYLGTKVVDHTRLKCRFYLSQYVCKR